MNEIFPFNYISIMSWYLWGNFELHSFVGLQQSLHKQLPHKLVLDCYKFESWSVFHLHMFCCKSPMMPRFPSFQLGKIILEYSNVIF